MAQINFNTRIKNKVDTFANWTANNPIILEGEIITVIVPAEAGAVVQEPAVLFKVGQKDEQGNDQRFNALPFAAAKAADVYDWAKAPTRPTYEAKDITGISQYIADYVEEEMGISVDTDTQYQVIKGANDYEWILQSKGKGDAAWANQNTITLPVAADIKAAIEALDVDDTVVAGQYVSGVKQVDGKIEVSRAALPTTTDAAVEGQYVSEVSQADGKITVKREALPDYTEVYDAKGSAAAVKGQANDDATKDTVYGAKAAAAAAQSTADAKVASVTAGDASVTIGGTATAPTVAAKVSADSDNALELTANGLKVVVPAAAEYSVVKDENAGDYAAVYHLTKDGANIGAAINIPKDMVVSSGEVVEDASKGTCIKLTLANADNDEILIPVGSLIEYVTAGSGANDAIQIAVSDDHKVTASVKEGSLTFAMLHTDVQASLNKANSAVQKVESGSANGTIAVDGSDVQVKGINTAAYETKEYFEQKAENEAKAVLGTEGDAATAATVYGAKAQATALNNAMDARVKDLEAKPAKDITADQISAWDAAEEIAHEHDNKSVLDGITAEKVAAWDKAEENVQADWNATSGDAAILNKPNFANIATSGNVNDLIQTSGDLIIFDCGTSTKNI